MNPSHLTKVVVDLYQLAEWHRDNALGIKSSLRIPGGALTPDLQFELVDEVQLATDFHESFLRRAVSAAYYALFQQLIQNIYECFDHQKTGADMPAWLHSRDISHRSVRNACRKFAEEKFDKQTIGEVAYFRMGHSLKIDLNKPPLQSNSTAWKDYWQETAPANALANMKIIAENYNHAIEAHESADYDRNYVVDLEASKTIVKNV